MDNLSELFNLIMPLSVAALVILNIIKKYFGN